MSPLASCTPALAENLLSDAREVTLGPGATFYRGTHHAETEKLGLVVTGLLRTFRRSLDGRQVTLRYAGPGRLIGLPAVLGGGAGAEGQALLESQVLVLSASRFRAVARRDPDLAWAVAEHLADIVRHLSDNLSSHLFLPMRSRVAHHLLDMASAEGDRLVVRSSHQDLADAVGSVREVVSRTLRELTSAGYISRENGVLVINDPNSLHGVTLGVV
ncbi:Crp/Fnr family transcriptional regulator [Capillimicrobium parvum]|uniref:Crp/Fnr family transcriptional regulator n=1 Tax=Capillimicrobium parvum TaxID=2884022 RepID=UPI00216ADBB8|nr:Crp/Fnr family transcriptional regulator [Capillimicrobium parvum]